MRRRCVVTHEHYQEPDVSSLSLHESLFSLQTETEVPNTVEGD